MFSEVLLAVRSLYCPSILRNGITHAFILLVIQILDGVYGPYYTAKTLYNDCLRAVYTVKTLYNDFMILQEVFRSI